VVAHVTYPRMRFVKFMVSYQLRVLYCTLLFYHVPYPALAFHFSKIFRGKAPDPASEPGKEGAVVP
jgi:hypothetical protein